MQENVSFSLVENANNTEYGKVLRGVEVIMKNVIKVQDQT